MKVDSKDFSGESKLAPQKLQNLDSDESNSPQLGQSIGPVSLGRWRECNNAIRLSQLLDQTP